MVGVMSYQIIYGLNDLNSVKCHKVEKYQIEWVLGGFGG